MPHPMLGLVSAPAVTLPGGLRVLRMIYWSARRDWRRTGHLLLAICDAIVTIGKLFSLRYVTDRRPIVAIALVEHLGDIVAAEPVARLARDAFPNAQIVWVVRTPYAVIPRAYPAVDHVMTVRCLTSWMLVQGARILDTVWDLHTSQRACPACSVPLVKAGPAASVTMDTYYGYGNLLAVQCLSAGLPVLSDPPALYPGSDAVLAVDALHLPKAFVVIHCASNEAVRDWTDAGWHALVSFVTRRCGMSVIEIGLRPRILTERTERTCSLCGDLSILETAEVIRRAALFVGIDSGPAHLANAVGTPSVILLGAYRGFARYTPYSGGWDRGDGADLLRAEGPASSLTADQVLAAIARRLGHTPPDCV